MIIRNGFMRDCEGHWHNMHMISNLYVREIAKRFIVVAEMKCMDGSNWYQTMSPDFHTQLEAEEALDDAFGYTG